MDLGLKGKVAIITGAGQGIGRQIAKTLAEEGAKVVVNDLFQERADAVAEEVRAAGGEALAVQADVTKQEEVNGMVKRTVEQWGGIDILVNNAGVPLGTSPQGTTFVETTKKDWDAAIELNMYGMMNCCRAVIEHMIAQRCGKIVSIISEAGRVGEPRLAAYSGAKAGIVGFTKALAREVARYCINVNCVGVGATLHEGMIANLKALGVTDEQIQEREQAIMRAYPLARGLQRLGLTSDIADAVAFLVSDRAPWITGQVLSASGGFSMVS